MQKVTEMGRDTYMERKREREQERERLRAWDFIKEIC